jgi:hypothetical protein
MAAKRQVDEMFDHQIISFSVKFGAVIAEKQTFMQLSFLTIGIQALRNFYSPFLGKCVIV